MQQLSIEISDKGTYQPLHCFKCGEMQDPEFSSYCSHVTFVYLPGYDFEYVHPDIENAIANILKQVEENDHLRVEDLLLDLPTTATSFIVEIKSSGMNCGPGSFRVLYGFDLS